MSEEKDRSVLFEERRQRELAKERKIHARRVSKPDAPQKIAVRLPDHR